MRLASDRETNRQRRARKSAHPGRDGASQAGAARPGAHTTANGDAAGQAGNSGNAQVASAGGPLANGMARASAPASHVSAGPSPTPMRAFLRSFVFAWRGLVYAIRTQRNARVHALIGAAAVALGIVLHISAVEFAILFVAITLVFVAEMFNTVAEACVDMITNEYHPLAQIAKDVAAGAVLLNAILSVVIGLFVFVPHLWPLVVRWLGW